MRKILNIIVLTLTFLLLVSCTEKEQGEIVGKVNDRVITVSEFNKRVSMYKPGIELVNGPEIWTKELANGKTYLAFLEETILEKIFMDEVIFNEAHQKGIKIDDETIKSELAKLKEQINSNAQIKEFYKTNNISDDFLEKQIEMDLTISAYEKQFKDSTVITDEEVIKQYEDKKDEYKIEKVKASHILFMIVDESLNPIPEEQKNQKKVLADEILVRVKNGEDFAKLAKEYSDDKASAVNGGELGEFGRGVMVKAFEDAAFSMEVGQISNLVETEFGYHIIKVEEKINKIQGLEEVKESIRAYLKNEKYQKNIEELKSSAKIEKYLDNIKKE